MQPAAGARAWFALQAGAGACWWAAVAASDDVRRWTLGGIDPALLVGPDLVLFVIGSAVVAATGNRVVAAVVVGWSALVTLGLAAYALVEQAAGWGVVAMVLATFGSAVAASLLWWGRVPLGWFFVGPFSFRPADDVGSARHVRRSLAQLVVFWTVFFVVVPAILVAIERRLGLEAPALAAPAWNVVGAVGFVLGSALGLWSCLTMAVVGQGTPLPAETARRLVVAGPYRHVRNPMAVAGALQTISIGLWAGSWAVVAIAFAGAVAWHIAIRPTEEADLRERFGDDYERYREHVRCWIPSPGWGPPAPRARV